MPRHTHSELGCLGWVNMSLNVIFALAKEMPYNVEIRSAEVIMKVALLGRIIL